MNPSQLPLVAITGMGRGESPQPGAALVQSLRRRWPDLRMAGLAYDALESGIYAPGHPEVSFTMPYPFCGSGPLLGRVDEIRASFPFTVLIPTLDAELEPWLAIEPELRRRGISTLLPTRASLRARRKQDLAGVAEAAGVKAPRTLAFYDPAEAAAAAGSFGGMVMVKGSLYEATQAVGPAEVHHQSARLLAEWGGPILIQEIVEGVELDLLALGDGSGGMRGRCGIRKLVVSSKGKGYAGVTIHDDALEGAASALVRELQWLGPVEFEFIRSQSGDLYLIEINPRFPAWADFPAAVGCNLAAGALQQLLGWPVDPLPDLPAGKLFIRHCLDVVCDAEEFGHMAVEGCTLPSISLRS